MGPALDQDAPFHTYKSPVDSTTLASLIALPEAGRSPTVATELLRVMDTPCGPVAPVGPGCPAIENFQLLKLEPPPAIKSTLMLTSVPAIAVITPSTKIVVGEGTWKTLTLLPTA
jgi:hypothetical protein